MMPWFNDYHDEERGRVTDNGGSSTKLINKKTACCALLVLMTLVAIGNITRGSVAPSLPDTESNSHARTLLDVELKGRQNGQHKDMLGSSNMKLAICAIVKDEAPYLSEWIEHHKLIGFDTILLYNDHSTDDTQCVLDSYAEQGFVVRVPDDVGGKCMKNLPWIHKGQITNNPQQAIFEACRRYLADKERKNGDVGSTWMLTNDVDEFVWFDKNKYGDVKTAFSSMLSAISVEKPDVVGSVHLPDCMYGPTGQDTYEPEFVMQRFVHRENYVHCSRKGFSRVSTIINFVRPEDHVVDGQVVHDPEELVGHIHLAHYKTKSRTEFYNRVCSSRYAFKYYKRKNRSPSLYFDSFEARLTERDMRMHSFAEGLKSNNLSSIAARCNTKYDNRQCCPKSVMEMRGEDGFLHLLISKLRQASFRPLVFGAGMGTTATHAMFDATCKLRLRSVHFFVHCGYGNEPPQVPTPGLLAHTRVVKAYNALTHCVSAAYWDDISDCPSVKETIETMQAHIDAVISSKDVDAIHDTPYPEFADYVMEAAERIRGIKPVVLLSKRSPRDWAQRRNKHDNDLVCKLRTMSTAGSTEQYIGQNIYWCLQTAMEKGMGANSILDIFDLVRFFDSDELYYSLSNGINLYQDHMKEKVQYQVNMFEQTLDSSQLAEDIDTITALSKVMSAGWEPESFFQRRSLPATAGIERRNCMQNFQEAFRSGRHCDKLVLFLHFHKAGGTSIIEYLRSHGLWFDLQTNSNPDVFEDIQAGDDIDFPMGHYFGNLRVHSSSETSPTMDRASDPNFWSSLYDRGLDFVNLEYKFVTPKIATNLLASSVYKVTQLRKPWDRFRSTFERELSLKCKIEEEQGAKEICFSKTTLGNIMSVERQEEWPGILTPNYYVRMLNGIADSSSDIELTREHLDIAKEVLASFDLVLILEDDEVSNLRRLWDMFGDFSQTPNLQELTQQPRWMKKANHKDSTMPQISNNKLKGEAMYNLLRAQIEEMRTEFEEQNALDNELYQFALQLQDSNIRLVEKN